MARTVTKILKEMKTLRENIKKLKGGMRNGDMIAKMAVQANVQGFTECAQELMKFDADDPEIEANRSKIAKLIKWGKTEIPNL